MKAPRFFVLLFLFFVIGQTMHGQTNFRLSNPDNPYDRYGKAPGSGPPFFYFGSASYQYHTAHSQYNSFTSAVSAAFSSWNNSGPVQFTSSSSSGLTLTADSRTDYGPAWSHPAWSGYQLTPSSADVVLSIGYTWSSTEQRLGASPPILDVQSMVVHEVGHIDGLAHPATDSYTHNASAPTMAGGDNDYFDNTLDVRSLETSDIYGTQFLQLRVPTLYSSLQTALNKAQEISIGYVYLMSNYTLSANITVPSGANLIIISSVTLNLNGYTITSTGGTITIESGATINNGGILKSGSTILTIYPTVQAALSAASSGQTVAVASGTHTFSSNLTIPNGITFETGTGATVNFASGYKLRIEGKLLANGTTFTCPSGQWYGIEFYNGNAGSSISYATIENAQYGVYNYGTNVPISNSTIRNNSTGAYIYGNSSTLSWNKIQNNTYGVNCAGYGDASIQVNNVLRYNSWAVYGDATSVPALGNYPGYNSLYSNDYYDVYSTYGGTIYARGNWWGSYPAYPSVTANVDYSNALSTDPNTWAGQIVESSTGKELRGLLTKISGSAEDDPGMKEVDQAYRLFLNENYEGALGLFQAIALKYPDSFAGSRALVFGDRIVEKLGRDSKANLISVITQRQNSKVASVANSLLMSRHVKEGNYQVALTSALALAGNTDKLIAKDALYNAGNILWYKQDNTARGAEYFRKLIAEYPGDPLSISAQATLGEWSGKASQPIAQTSSSPTAELSLQNFPNPFNPTTVIHFTLPQSGIVSLKVFDMLGREVATLLNEYRAAGTHQVNFNASSLTSGVYFYKLEAGGKSMLQKMLLIK